VISPTIIRQVTRVSVWLARLPNSEGDTEAERRRTTSATASRAAAP
jgi:hypothetical protein